MACKIVEEYAKEYAEEYLEEIDDERIRNALSKGMDPMDLAVAFDVSIDYVLSLNEEIRIETK